MLVWSGADFSFEPLPLTVSKVSNLEVGQSRARHSLQAGP
jgi:hypothetical protein